MKHKFLIALFLAPLIQVFSQERLDILTLSGRYGFPASYDSIYEGKGVESGFMASLVAPAKLSEKSIWYSSLNYFYWKVSNDEQMPEDVMNPIQIHGLILRTGLIQKFENDRSLQVLFAPRLMTDFKNVNSDHFQLGGIVVYEKIYRETLRLGFGALYNQEFSGPNLVPLVNVDWKINGRWSLVGLLPIYSKLKYKINDRLDAGWSHFGLVTTYRLGHPEYEGDYIERKSIDETLYARYNLFGDFFLEGRIGYAFGRSYKQYEADQKVDLSIPLITFGDNRIAKTASIHDGMIASIRLVYSVSIENRK
ncbi:DUF6268 family outer membrane beta-barrel protein [Lutimonas saemankumensis]|uniref:DUF6268 family outer membrane beta-barrel protein n=1 Tax=Lutimonas saemankumensis TaxID=483016 RepID=UPI001CD1C741|nr:DUF6268 family outer membrane beta-barrel protein [Lutimonas saemankumensis]MCA0933274.1 DUF6268 family outer membrane beta-barrel protein [Lutimonas saemankumensis]